MEELPSTDQLFENPDLLSKFLEDITVETSTPLGERLSLENVNLEDPEIKDSLLLLGKREQELRILSEFVNTLISKTEEQLGQQLETISQREHEIQQIKQELASLHDENNEMKMEMKYKAHDDISKIQESHREKMEQKDHEIQQIKAELMNFKEENEDLKDHFHKAQDAYKNIEKKFSEMETHYREVVASLNEAKRQIAILETKNTELEEKQNEHEIKTKDLEKKTEDTDNLRGRLNTMKTMNDDLKEEVDLLKIKTTQLEKADEENIKLKTQLENIQKEFERVRDERDWLEQEIEEKSSKLMDSATKYANLEEKYNDMLEKSPTINTKDDKDSLSKAINNGIASRNHAHRKTLLSDLISTKRYFDPHSFEDDVQQTESDTDLTSLGIGQYDNYRTSLTNENNMKDSHSLESFEVHVPKETAKLVPLNMDSRTGRAEKREPKGVRSQSKEYKEKKAARKQHNEEFFALTFQSILMNSEYFDAIAGNAPALKKEFWSEILDKNIPYHQWYKLIDKKIEEYCQQNYKAKAPEKVVPKKKFCFGLFG